MNDIVIIGGGNMATQLCKSFFDNGHPVTQIYNRTIGHIHHLKIYSQHPPVDSLAKLTTDADLYLICISDSAINEVATGLKKNIKNPKAVVAHTSGSTPSSVLEDAGIPYYGTFYPLQSLRKERLLSLADVPVLINSNTQEGTALLKDTASIISDKVFVCEDDIRSRLHVPAVFVNNFVNYLYSVAYEYCAKENLPFEYLHALMSETTSRIVDGNNPDQMQTGPAVRNDRKTLKRHFDQLRMYHEYRKLYIYLTNRIRSHNL